MKKFNIFTVLLAAVMAVAALFGPVPLALTDPAIRSGSALLIEKGSGVILYQKNKDEPVSPGGAAKIMTLLLAVEAIENEHAGLLDRVTPSEAFLDGIGEDDKILGIKPGETMKLESLLYSAYIDADNDACNVVAEYLGGSIADFVGRMNQKAQQLGCTATRFTSPGGTGDASQQTTPWDQYLIFKNALEYPLFIKIAGEQTYSADPTDYAYTRTFINNNVMLNKSSEYYYNKCVAGCYDPRGEKGRNLLSFAKSGELALITVLFGSPDISGDNGAARNGSFLEARRLFDWGFGNFAWQIILDEDETVAREEVELADDDGTAELRPAASINALVRTDLVPDDIIKNVVIYARRDGRQLTAPISEGTVLGDVSVWIDGINQGKALLVAAGRVGLNEKQFIKNNVKDTLALPWVQIGIGILLALLVGYALLVVRDIKQRRMRRRAMEETRQKIIEGRKHPAHPYR